MTNAVKEASPPTLPKPKNGSADSHALSTSPVLSTPATTTKREAKKTRRVQSTLAKMSEGFLLSATIRTSTPARVAYPMSKPAKNAIATPAMTSVVSARYRLRRGFLTAGRSRRPLASFLP